MWQPRQNADDPLANHPMSEVDQLRVSVTRQELSALAGKREVLRFPVSTAAGGIGFRKGSCQTPGGQHRVRVKVGRGCPLGAVLYKRRWTGEILNQELRDRFPTRDWVLTRALWLQGLEPDLNRGGDVDTLRRLIYIHGTHEEDLVGQPVSFGCVRMRNADIIELFDRVPAGCHVSIE